MDRVVAGVDGPFGAGGVADAPLGEPVAIWVRAFGDGPVMLWAQTPLLIDLLAVQTAVVVGELVEPLEV